MSGGQECSGVGQQQQVGWDERKSLFFSLGLLNIALDSFSSVHTLPVGTVFEEWNLSLETGYGLGCWYSHSLRSHSGESRSDRTISGAGDVSRGLSLSW